MCKTTMTEISVLYDREIDVIEIGTIGRRSIPTNKDKVFIPSTPCLFNFKQDPLL